jgi:two-component system, LytTR family, sensor kinase
VERYYVSLLVRLGVVASIASVLARSGQFQSILMKEERTLRQRLELALWLSVVFGGSVATRVVSPTYQAADVGMEGAMVAGLMGGYVTGLVSGILISLPAMFSGEHLSMPLLAAIGVLGGLLRDSAPRPEEVWRFSPFFDLNIWRFFREKREYRRTAFHLVVCAAILFAEFVRYTLGFWSNQVFYLLAGERRPHPLNVAALYASTLFAVAIPLKIWNNTRNERKLEEQQRLLMQARLEALTSQINPHFLFNTLNSVSSLIRTHPNQARVMVVKLSKVLRRLLRKHENFTSLRDELSFIDDYLGIETVRFGEKLRFEKNVDDDTLDMLVPSMLLQPLIENSIKHGLSSKVEGGVIGLRARRSGPRLHLTVEDDGVGIPEARLATMMEDGIGVSNVHERLKVLFGNDYRMWIESQPGRGTRVEMEIPELQTTLAAVS